MSEFYREIDIGKTRTAHKCEACRKPIEIGSPAKYIAQKHDGDFDAVHYHVQCREAEIAINNASGFSPAFPEDWIQLRDMEQDDLDWLKIHRPEVYLIFKDEYEDVD